MVSRSKGEIACVSSSLLRPFESRALEGVSMISKWQVNSKIVPILGALVTVIYPPIRATRWRQMERPRPVPP